jgi:hypothetical protein
MAVKQIGFRKTRYGRFALRIKAKGVVEQKARPLGVFGREVYMSMLGERGSRIGMTLEGAFDEPYGGRIIELGARETCKPQERAEVRRLRAECPAKSLGRAARIGPPPHLLAAFGKLIGRDRAWTLARNN